MAVTVTEKFESRHLTTGENATLELAFNVFGTDDEAQAKQAVLAASPETYGSSRDQPYLRRQGVQLEPEGPQLWNATVRYDSNWDAPVWAEDSFEFDTTGGTQHITQSLSTVTSYGRAPNCYGAIGVSQSAVEGVDIVVPVFNFSETHHFSSISWSYRHVIAGLTGKVNYYSFRGFDRGEVLFLGASGSRRDSYSSTPWEVTFRFAAQQNRTNIQVGNITGIRKWGWEYMWVRYEPADDYNTKTRIKRPVGVYIEKVYELASFAGLGI
ncbi:MAG: hypothetical protein LBT97_03750 [Planctomycetota bacterium]|jgi:hypothetical protein|nr:hypothetical protein [Planctomycetota bacterium]